MKELGKGYLLNEPENSLFKYTGNMFLIPTKINL